MSSLNNWLEEKRSAWLYQKVAEHELDTVRKNMFLELATAAESQAGIWEKKLSAGGSFNVKFKPDIRSRLVAGLISIFGANSLRFILAAMKVRGMAVYAGAPTSHSASASIEQRHKGVTHAGNLRAAIFGINDGLISNLALLSGVAGGAAATHSVILLTGIAGLLAGACSMASGEYISVRSQKEFFEYQIDLEREELEAYPEEEAGELACIYRARGLDADRAQKLADYVISDPERALDTLAREELGLDPKALGNPMGAGISSFVSFALGALIPLLPFVCVQGSRAIYWSASVTAISLLLVGAVISLFSNRGALFSGLRMLLVGSVSAGLTWFVGHWLGAII